MKSIQAAVDGRCLGLQRLQGRWEVTRTSHGVGFVGGDPAPTFVIILVVYLEYIRKLGVEIAAFWITQALVSDYKQI